MKEAYFVHCVLLVCVILVTDALSTEASKPMPLDVVKSRTRALNDHQLEAFLSTYADDVEVFVYPNRPLGKGKSHIRRIFGPMIKKRDVHVEIGNSMTADSYAVVEMRTSFGNKTEPTVAIYEVRDGLIRSVCFVRDGIRARSVPKNEE